MLLFVPQPAPLHVRIVMDDPVWWVCAACCATWTVIVATSVVLAIREAGVRPEEVPLWFWINVAALWYRGAFLLVIAGLLGGTPW